MNANYYALYISIVQDISVDKALIKMDIRYQRNYKANRKPVSSKFEYIDEPGKLLELKKTFSYKEIAKLYNVESHTIANQISRYRKECINV